MTIKNLSKAFDSNIIIENLNLEISDKGITCFFGKSGCGKTTLLNIISGLIKDYSGEISFPGGNVSYIFQENRLLPWINVLNNVILVVKNKTNNSHDIERRAKHILERLGLIDHINKYPFELSGGMKRRVNIARALMFDFDLLIMDEPFKELDADTKEKALSLIKGELGERPALFVSHDMSEALQISNEIFIVDGTPFRILRRFKPDKNSNQLVPFCNLDETP